jgi:hypothetical protein
LLVLLFRLIEQVLLAELLSNGGVKDLFFQLGVDFDLLNDLVYDAFFSVGLLGLLEFVEQSFDLFVVASD